ncbi:GNAT family N-acetyltransferase [Trinickia sp.]|uniref:GNAT family N-acetyltransferase n=1 Tax=Trinickia sp. TaxID=2571163 RepID=UPI003F7D97C0
MPNDTLHISSDKHALDIDMIYAFLRDHAYWSRGIPRETLERAIDGSLCFGAYIEGRQVAFARLVTDMATFAYLCDVFVLPEHRKRGYGQALVRHIFDSDFAKGLRRIVLVTSDARELYRPHGFRALASPEKYMEIARPDIYAASRMAEF